MHKGKNASHRSVILSSTRTLGSDVFYKKPSILRTSTYFRSSFDPSYVLEDLLCLANLQMAFSNQFSLSVELTKLVPFGPLASVAGRGLLNLIRDLQESGSDLVTEEGLAEVFGRNRIDPRFESSFRTAVRQSAIHQFADVAELMIEGGPGPTVRRSLQDPIYFRTILQLSLLTWAHELGEFAKALAQALDRRATENGQKESPPRLDGVRGTLRAVREQTSGFMWELIFSAVDQKLAPLKQCETTSHLRLLPVSVLQGLLDTLTAVQHFPEARLIRIRSIDGATTIVVWAHHVLGLTVVVESAHGSERFGDGPESVHVDCGTHEGYDDPYAKTSLFNETDDLLFTIEQTLEDFVLQPAVRRHQLLGFGHKIMSTNQENDMVVQSLVHSATTSALALVKQELAVKSDLLYRLGRDIYPSSQKMLTVARLLFPGYEHVIDIVDPRIVYPCLVRSRWTMETLPEHIARVIEEGQCELKDFRKDTRRLTHMILILAMVQNVENCPGLALDSLYLPKLDSSFGMTERAQLGEAQYQAQKAEEWVRPLPMPTASDAFEALVSLMKGQDFPKHESSNQKISVISTWGWTLCTGSVIENDPSELHPGLAVFQGVPMRKGERRRLILDSGIRNPWPYKAKYERRDELSKYRIFAKPGDTKTLRTWTRSKKTRHFIATTEEAFEVLKLYECRSLEVPQVSWEMRVGFYSMQHIYWNLVHLPSCEHTARLDEAVTLPDETWAFDGFCEGDPNHHKAGAVEVALVAGDKSARWLMAGGSGGAYNLEDGFRGFDRPTRFLRTRDCCFECAITMVRNARFAHSVLVIL